MIACVLALLIGLYIILVYFHSKKVEGFDANPVNSKYWPYYYYSFPYQNMTSGPFPPGLYSSLYNWQPAFETSGWSNWLRPGMYYNAWPRGRWVRKQEKTSGSYYYINNGGDSDRVKDFS